jgi:hypothetical protein
MGQMELLLLETWGFEQETMAKTCDLRKKHYD